MNWLTKATVEGVACRLMIGDMLLVRERVWLPATVEPQGQPATSGRQHGWVTGALCV